MSIKSKMVLATAFILSFSASYADVPVAESDALADLYNATDGVNWTNNSNWLTGDPCVNAWFGITCDVGDTTVTQLQLVGNGLDGTLPATLGNLSNLEQFNLGLNQLTGSIPTSLGNLKNVWFMGFWSNQLMGGIPTELGAMTSLRGLNLSDNLLSGSIPNELGNLAGLDALVLNNNQLTGSIPASIGNAEFLFLLDLGETSSAAQSHRSLATSVTSKI